jgi:hypothetical protein
MKNITELDKDIKSNEDLKNLAMDIMQYIFSRSQENLVEPMPWGDEDYPSGRSPTAISDTAVLLLSGVPPYWEDNKRIVFRYDAPHAVWVEYGTPPHAVSGKRLIDWSNRKLRLKGKVARSAAYAVANKIKKEGIPPHPYIRPAVDDGERHFNLVFIKGEA